MRPTTITFLAGMWFMLMLTLVVVIAFHIRGTGQ